MVRSLIQTLKPPGIEASADEIMNWRWWVSITTVFCTVSTVLIWAFSLGFLPFFSGFASKNDFRGIEVRQIEKDIWEFKEKQCEAIITENREALDTVSKILSERRGAYYTIAGYNYHVPSCVQIGFNREV